MMFTAAVKTLTNSPKRRICGGVFSNINTRLFTTGNEFTPISVDIEHYTSGWNIDDIDEFKKSRQYSVVTFNKISQKGLSRFPKEWYKIEDHAVKTGPANVIMLRSHKLKEDEVDVAVRAIARCGAGTNNIPVARMTECGIPVFNTPGANANAVKELILCGMFLGSRRIVDGINHMRKLGEEGLAKERVEKDKAMFGGRELKDKTLAIIGLGHIGAATARDARSLGMSIKVRHVTTIAANRFFVQFVASH
jgi:D-3-phosphoglycerate dehydrogenase / 2-oxoglutarate reductase